MLKHYSRTLAAAALVALIAALAACGDSPEARRKQAQANADKYIEMIKANDYEGAYHKTFAAQYKAALPIEAWIRYRQGFANRTGPIQSYTVVKFVQDPARSREIRFTYAINTTNYPADP